MKITIMIEGETERAFKPHLQRFLQKRLRGSMPKLDMHPCFGRIYKEDRLRRTVENLLRVGNPPSDAVIALTDIYTGTSDFATAADAKTKMRGWVGPNPNFYPHCALHDFEAWLLPYWSDIRKIAGHNRNAPPGVPESVNHGRPPSYHLKEIFRTGAHGRAYSKTRDANRILKDKDLAESAAQCPELRSFLNTILQLCGGALL